jgi:hypothetical protein
MEDCMPSFPLKANAAAAVFLSLPATSPCFSGLGWAWTLNHALLLQTWVVAAYHQIGHAMPLNLAAYNFPTHLVALFTRDVTRQVSKKLHMWIVAADSFAIMAADCLKGRSGITCSFRGKIKQYIFQSE